MSSDPFVGPNERTPGQFRRKGKDGPPIVSDPERRRQPVGNKPELLAKAAARQLPIPDKITVKQLLELLGDEPTDAVYARTSNFGAIVDDSWGLEKWRERQLLTGAREHLDQLATIDIDDRDALDRLAEACHTTAQSSLAADRGTHIHTLTERVDRDEPYTDLLDHGDIILGIPTVLQERVVKQWIQFRRAHRLNVAHVELAVVNDEWRCAGTLDRVDTCDTDIVTVFGTIRKGERFIGDIKTGGDVINPKYAVQVCAYADSVPYDTINELRQPWDRQPNTRIGFIYHYPLGRAVDGEQVEWQMIPVDLNTGRQAGRICFDARHAASYTGAFAAPLEPLKDRRATLMDRYALLNDTARAAFTLLGITKNSTDDEVQAALDSVDPFATVTPPPPRQRAAEPPTNPVDDRLGELRQATAKQIRDLTDDEAIRLCIIRAVNPTALSILQLSDDDCRQLQHIVAGFDQLTLTVSDDGTYALTGPDTILGVTTQEKEPAS